MSNKPTTEQILEWAQEIAKSTQPGEMIPVLSARQMQKAFTLAYLAGAKAMRERAARSCDFVAACGKGKNDYHEWAAEYCAKLIRELRDDND